MCYNWLLELMKTTQKYRLSLILSFTLIFAATPSVPAEDEGKPSASGYNVLRIEQEDRYAVPEGKANEVWNFLEETFVKDQAGLKAINPDFSSYYNEEQFTDVYFDTPSFQMLEAKSGVRHRKRINLTNPEDRKSGRELIQIKFSAKNGLLERKEMKFEVKYPGKLKDAEDTHPLLGLIKRSRRNELKDALKTLGVDTLQIRPILTIIDHRTRIYILKDGKPFISISHDVAQAEMNGKKAGITEIEFELNEIAFTEANDATRRDMESVNQKLIAKILKRFSYLKRDLTPKYNRAYEALKN